MIVVWKKQFIHREWRRVGGVLIPREKDSSSINQFRHICLLNVEGKIFFGILAHRLACYLEKNGYTFSGCLEHAMMTWH